MKIPLSLLTLALAAVPACQESVPEPDAATVEVAEPVPPAGPSTQVPATQEPAVSDSSQPSAPVAAVREAPQGARGERIAAPKAQKDEAQEAVAFVDFAPHAFPPTLPHDDNHADPWSAQTCLLCHSRGIGDAPRVRHSGMSGELIKGNCRSCHLPRGGEEEPLTEAGFSANAFPPLLPGDSSHSGAWMRDDCLLCHESGTRRAPRVRHKGMSPLLLKARCRSCHLPGAPSIDANASGD